MKVIVLLCAVLVLESNAKGSEKKSCPAISNDKVGWSKGKDLISALNEGKCIDLSNQCGQCTDLCMNPAYTHWIDKWCAKTCGLCKDEAELVKRQSGTFCWEANKGYGGTDVLKKVAFTSVYDCEKQCLKDSKCVGASITEFNRSPAYCILAKSGARGTRSNQFGAEKSCMRQSPLKPCSDAWNRCSCCMRNMCRSSCPYYKALLSKVCRKTCGYCNEEENENADVEWKEMDDIKLVGKVIQKKLTLKEAKEVCATCGGINCKKGKCMVVGDIKKQKKKKGFTAYKPEE